MDEYSKGLPKVCWEEFVRCMLSIAPSPVCPTCQNESFAVLTEQETEYASLFVSSSIGAPGSVGMFATHCKNCGLVSHHKYETIKEWLDNNPRGDNNG